MILITGATGQLGRLVIAQLLKTLPANRIVAAVRNPAKAQDLEALGIQVRLGDYEQPGHWPAALQGVEKVLLISAGDIGTRAAKHEVVIDAVKASGTVAFIAYTSMLRADTCRIPFASEDRETEQMIVASGKPFVFLRHGWYTENYVMNAEHAVQSGELHGAAGAGRISGASRADYAEAAATVLTSGERLQSIYELAGDSSFTLADVAAELAKQSGRSVHYVDLPEAAYQQLLVSFGLPELVATALALADTGVANGDVYSERQDLSRLIGRDTTPLGVVVASALARGAAS